MVKFYIPNSRQNNTSGVGNELSYIIHPIYGIVQSLIGRKNVPGVKC